MAPVKKPAKKAAKKTAKKSAKKTVKKPAKAAVATIAAPKKPRVFGMSFASVYPLYVQKAEKKGRTKGEVDAVIAWLTGYAGETLDEALQDRRDLEAFFDRAPRMNPNAGLVQGVVCGVRVEEVEDPLMRRIRILDKLVDELAQGKKMAAILRA